MGMVFLITLLLLLCIGMASTSLPQCGYQCSSPTRDAICEPHCEPPVCQVCHNDTGTPECADTDKCEIQCAIPSVYVPDQCPLCETQCPGDELCDPDDTNCLILCEAPACSWKCVAPPKLPKPVCVRHCEEPSCAFVESGAVRGGGNRTPILVVGMTLLLSLYL